MYSYPHRTGCDVLEEMRSCYKTRNFASILGLVEEMQGIANRMEAGLEYQKDIEGLHKERKELIKEVEELKKLKEEYEPKES